MTTVTFKKFRDGGDVIALFPEQPWSNAGDITSYQHVGQHGAASPELLAADCDTTEPALPEEFQPLLRELVEQIGYADLNVQPAAGLPVEVKYNWGRVPVQPHCFACDSTEIRKDAYAAWDAGAQEWVLQNTFDHSVCDSCGHDTVEWKLAPPASPPPEPEPTMVIIEDGTVRGVKGGPVTVRDYDTEGADLADTIVDEDGKRCFESRWTP